jgi:hypothetical protein
LTFNFLRALLCIVTENFTIIPGQEDVWRNEGRALRIYLSRHEKETGGRLKSPDGLTSNKTASCQFGWGWVSPSVQSDAEEKISSSLEIESDSLVHSGPPCWLSYPPSVIWQEWYFLEPSWDVLQNTSSASNLHRRILVGPKTTQGLLKDKS